MTTNSPPDGLPPATERERTTLDSAHVGDIQGAFGTIGQHEGGRRGLRLRRSRSWDRG